MVDETTQTKDPPLNSIQFRTKDIDQAAFMWLQPGSLVIKLEPDANSPNTLWFIFKLEMTEVELNQLLFDYANGMTMVEPSAFCVRQEKLRDLLHMGRGRRR